MKYDSSSFLNIEAQGGTSVRPVTSSASSESSQATDDKKASARNWAWAHHSEAYDWMDSHSPFSPADLAG
jgi:hypothetical protein